jgi:hypothetical protein
MTKDNKNDEADLKIPKKTNGEECTLEGLIGDQKDTMGCILKKTYKWFSHLRGTAE